MILPLHANRSPARVREMYRLPESANKFHKARFAKMAAGSQYNVWDMIGSARLLREQLHAAGKLTVPLAGLYGHGRTESPNRIKVFEPFGKLKMTAPPARV